MEETVTIVTNLDRICRTCLNEKNVEELRYIFENSLDDMLLQLADIKVYKYTIKCKNISISYCRL